MLQTGDCHVGTRSDLPKIKWPPVVQRTYCRTLSPWPGWPFPVTGPQFPHWHIMGWGLLPAVLLGAISVTLYLEGSSLLCTEEEARGKAFSSGQLPTPRAGA